jgi:hypothetical protein
MAAEPPGRVIHNADARLLDRLMALNSAGPEKPQWHESDVEPITTGGNSSSTTRWNSVRERARANKGRLGRRRRRLR